LQLASANANAVNFQNSAPHVAVRESGIDSNKNITKMNTQIALIQNKIDILNQKNNLGDEELDSMDILYENLQKLTNKKHTIKVG